MADIKIPVIDMKGKEVGQQSASSDIFAIQPNAEVLHFVCEGQRFRFYKKTACTKTRSAVRGGGKKARKQKGSGMSRQGGNRGPHWVGGGVVFGPTPIKREFKVNKQLRNLAFKSLLSDRYSGGQLRVLKGEASEPKTKVFEKLIGELSVGNARIGFVVSKKEDGKLSRGVRNLKNVDLLTEEAWTPYDFIKTDFLIFSESALGALVNRLTPN